MTTPNQAERHVAFVTGASYGVGAATALALARDGFDLALSATKAENLRETMVRLEGLCARVLPLILDLRAQASIDQAVAETLRTLGGVHVLVNNAGANLRALAVDVTRADWDDVIAT